MSQSRLKPARKRSEWLQGPWRAFEAFDFLGLSGVTQIKAMFCWKHKYGQRKTVGHSASRRKGHCSAQRTCKNVTLLSALF